MQWGQSYTVKLIQKGPTLFLYFGYVPPASKHKLNAVSFIVAHVFHGVFPFVVSRHHPSAPTEWIRSVRDTITILHYKRKGIGVVQK